MFYRLSLEPWDQQKRKTPKISGLNGNLVKQMSFVKTAVLFINIRCKMCTLVTLHPLSLLSFYFRKERMSHLLLMTT